MTLEVIYDVEVDVLRIVTGEKGKTSTTLLDLDEVVVDLTDECGRHVVGIGVMWASDYLPLGKRGYDAKSDTLVMGKLVGKPDLVTRNGDIVTYWKSDTLELGQYMTPVCVAITEASKHLSVKNIQRLGHESETELARTLVE